LKESFVLADYFTPRFSLLSKELIFLNHGWGTKKTPGNLETQNPKIMSNYRKFRQIASYIICLNDFDSSYFLDCPELKDLKKPKFQPLGLPRNDYLVKHKKDETFRRALVAQLHLKPDDKIFLYVPTHREIKKLDEKVLNMILKEFKEIDSELPNRGIKILFRPHYFTTNLSREISKYKNIFYVGHNVYKDPRPLLLSCDYLITDYSSIFVDYLLLEKPVIFYPFDLEEYESIRGLVISFDNPLQTPGPKISALLDLIYLNEAVFRNYNLMESVAFFHKYVDGHSTERVAKFLVDLLEGKTEKSTFSK